MSRPTLVLAFVAYIVVGTVLGFGITLAASIAWLKFYVIPHSPPGIGQAFGGLSLALMGAVVGAIIAAILLLTRRRRGDRVITSSPID